MALKPDKTRNGGTWTEAQYWAAIRSHLRRMFRFNWQPQKQALLEARRKYEGPNNRQQWEFKCATCGGHFMRKDVEIDHVVPCGSLKGLADVGPFLERLLPENMKAYQILCKAKCHREKTALERAARKL